MERVAEHEPEKVQVKVKVVRENPNKMSPLIGYFANGFDPLQHSSSSSYQVYRNTNNILQLVVKPADSPFEFVGGNYTGVEGVKKVLGILDKDSQTLTFVPIAGNEVFRLEEKVKGEEKPTTTTTTTFKKMTPREKALRARQTIEMWGTKKAIQKARKRLALRLALGIDEELDSQKDLELDEELDSQKDLELDEMQNVLAKCSESTKSHVTRNIPPYDASATTPQNVYPLHQIILKGEWRHLEDIYILLQQGVTANFSSYPSFIRNRIEKLNKIEDESEKKKLSCIFSYINHLIKFKDQRSKCEGQHSMDEYPHFDEEHHSMDEYPHFDEEHHFMDEYQHFDEEHHFMDEYQHFDEEHDFMDEFKHVYVKHHLMDEYQHSMDDASSSNHQIPNILLYKFTTMFDFSDTEMLLDEKVDLLISYVLVLTLFADEFQTDYRDIAKDLRMRSLDIKLHYENLGCKVSRMENKNNGEQYFCATLHVPLQFPD